MDNPKTLMEAIRAYADPKVSEDYFVARRWPDGVCCPTCGSTKIYRLGRQRRWKCSVDHPLRQFSVKTGTIMEDSPLSLDKWLCAIWLIINAKNGISSHETHRALGITQKTAWFLNHRIRYALKYGTFTKMSGTVEADESYIGGAIKNFRKGKLTKLRESQTRPNGSRKKFPNYINKTVVMGMLERGQDGAPSQARMNVIDSAHGRHLHAVIRDNVELGSNLMTDSLKGYTMLREDYIHQTINHAVKYAEGQIHTNGLENFWSLLKRTLKGTYVAVDPIHLDRYLVEQCFRFNNREMTDGERFMLAAGRVPGKQLTWKSLTGKTAAS